MDRISGMLPQVGWSPALAPVTAEKAPATTVEAVSQTSNAGSGMGANVDTGGDLARAAQIAEYIRNNANSAETTVLANSQDVDPDAPAGPPPTFDVSPLEAKVAELRDPETKKTKPDTNTTAAATATATDGWAKQNASQAAGEDRIAATAHTGWQTQESTAQRQSLDLLR